MCNPTCTLHDNGPQSQAERQANDTTFDAAWDPQDPMEAYFDRLEDSYVATVIAQLLYTMEQLVTHAIMGIQLSRLYSQALIDWQAKAPALHTWENLKIHFTAAYIARIQSGHSTTAANGFYIAANLIADDAIMNIKAMLTSKLLLLQIAHKTTHQVTLEQLQHLTAQQNALQLALHAAKQHIATHLMYNWEKGNMPPTPLPGQALSQSAHHSSL